MKGLNEVNRQWVLATRPQGMVSAENFEFKETAIPEPAEGEVLIRNLYLSFDPTQRAGWRIGRATFRRCRSVRSCGRFNRPDRGIERPGFAEGDLVQTMGGWQDYLVTPTSGGMMPLSKIPPGVPPTLPLSALGLTGQTAYWGCWTLASPRKARRYWSRVPPGRPVRWLDRSRASRVVR